MHTNHSRRSQSARWLLVLGTAAALAAGCSDDEGGENAAGGGASAAGKGGTPGKAGSSGKAGTAGKAGSTAAEAGAANGEGGVAGENTGAGTAGAGGSGALPGEPVTFEIPAAGGEVEVTMASGNAISFTFPASAGGKTVTLTPETSGSIGWDDGRFTDVLKMEPDGLTFDDPVEIRTSDKDMMIFHYSSVAEKSPADGLPMNGAGDALLLDHFSTLAIVPAGVSCDSTSGWVATADDAACTEHGAASTRLSFTCKAYTYCLLINANCCAEPGAAACELGMPALTLTYTPADTNGGQFPYCDRSPAGGEGGAGGTGGTAGAGAGGAPDEAGGAAGAPGCLVSGSEASPTGTGSCVDPWTISLLTSGATASHTAASGAAYWGGATCAASATREDVYRINPDPSWTSIDVGVDAVGGNDTKVVFMNSDASCNGGNESLCANSAAGGVCELASATKVELGNTNAIFIVVASDSASAQVTTRFQIH